MNTQIECPSCQQSVEIKTKPPILWMAATGILAVMLMVCTYSMIQARNQAWDNRLKNYGLAVAVDRAEILYELQQQFFLTDQERYVWLTNNLGSIPESPIKLEGRVTGHGPHDVTVISMDGDPGFQWPMMRDGRIVQGGVFELRHLAGNPAYSPAAIVTGMGYDPLPIILTNDTGERILKMTYRFVPESIR